MWHGTGAHISGLLLQTGAVLISIVMLKSNLFNKLPAWNVTTLKGKKTNFKSKSEVNIKRDDFINTTERI